MVTPQKVRTEYWPEKDFEEVARSLDEQTLESLYDSLNQYAEKDGAEVTSEHLESFQNAFYEGKRTEYDKAFEGIRELAKEEIKKESQPEWAWDIFSQSPKELDYDLLEIPSGGENKGMLVDRELENIFLYPKKANGISAPYHTETWRLSIDNVKSVGGKWAGGKYEGASLTFLEDTVVDALQTQFNQEMVMNDSLRSFFKNRVGEEEAGRYSSKFNDNAVQELSDENWVEKWASTDEIESGELENWLEEQAEGSELDSKEIRNRGKLEFLIEEGYFLCAGIEDFNYTTGNIAFIMPDNVEEMSTEEAYDRSELIFVDAGEIEEEEEGPNSGPFIEQDLKNNPWITEEMVRSEESGSEDDQSGFGGFQYGISDDRGGHSIV